MLKLVHGLASAPCVQGDCGSHTSHHQHHDRRRRQQRARVPGHGTRQLHHHAPRKCEEHCQQERTQQGEPCANNGPSRDTQAGTRPHVVAAEVSDKAGDRQEQESPIHGLLHPHRVRQCKQSKHIVVHRERTLVQPRDSVSVIGKRKDKSAVVCASVLHRATRRVRLRITRGVIHITILVESNIQTSNVLLVRIHVIIRHRIDQAQAEDVIAHHRCMRMWHGTRVYLGQIWVGTLEQQLAPPSA
mmetsp:Transcript_22013/g.70861  ORF Transcript_22013/g.70861 Transcript_22013/m.70861 type:complete len:244 (+) Transcript_22013:1283-2014(+)